MIYNIDPQKTINSIKFGELYTNVRTNFDSNYETFVNSYGMEIFKDTFPVDYYADQGIVCHYDKWGKLEAMVFFPPARPIFLELDVLNMPAAKLIAHLKQVDPMLETDAEGATSRRLSFGVLFSPDDESEDAPAYSFLSGCAGYYD